MIKASVKKKPGFVSTRNKLIRDTSKAMVTGLDVWSQDLQRIVIRAISSGSRSGQIYTVKGRTYVASRVGEAPAKVTGELSRSILLRKEPKRFGKVGRGIKTKKNVIQANWETGFGGRNVDRSRARPYMASNFRRTQRREMVLFVARLRKVVA